MEERHLPPTLGDDGEPEKPSVARMYDYMLGGFQNAAVDRAAVRRAQGIYPDIAFVARANRAFLRRAVTFLLDRGIEQFLDLGSGIPTAATPPPASSTWIATRSRWTTAPRYWPTTPTPPRSRPTPATRRRSSPTPRRAACSIATDRSGCYC